MRLLGVLAALSWVACSFASSGTSKQAVFPRPKYFREFIYLSVLL